MDKALKARWIADLRANPDKQGIGKLQGMDADCAIQNCCLGRLALLVGVPYNNDGYFDAIFIFDNGEKRTTTPPDGFCGLSQAEIAECWHRNDGWHSQLEPEKSREKQTFPELADWIEANIPSDGDA